MTRHLIATLLCGSPALAAPLHGPLVVWNHDPAHQARIVWIETAGASRGSEGVWSSGRAGFGFGDGDDATEFPNMRGHYDSLAIRRHVDLPPTLDPDHQLVLEVNYDDAFIAWLDGREVTRRHVGDQDGRPAAIARHESGAWEAIPLGTVRDLVRSQRPVLALQGFNRGLDSSDFSLDARLLAIHGTQRTELVPQRSFWEYLAKDQPDPLWFSRTSLGLPPGGRTAPAYNFSYRPAGSDDSLTASVTCHDFADSGDTLCSVELAKLAESTIYQFEIARPRTRDPAVRRQFRTAPAQPANLCFVTGGDMFHSRKLLDPMNRRAGLENPLFALIGGDLAYANGVDAKRWYEWLDSWDEFARTPGDHLIPMIAAIGNHEVKGIAYEPERPPGPAAAAHFYQIFVTAGPPQVAHRAIDFGDWMTIILLDSGHTASIASQVPFLQRTLADRRTVPRKFVCYHRPAWGTGTKPDAAHIQRLWCPLFEQAGIDAVFENDHHVFKRTLPLRAGKVDEVNGIPYLGDGAWGVDVRKIDPKELKRRPWLATAKPLNHLWRIDLTKEGFTATAKTADGTTIDQLQRP